MAHREAILMAICRYGSALARNVTVYRYKPYACRMGGKRKGECFCLRKNRRRRWRHISERT